MNRSRSENFTVASRLLPSRARRHLLAFYGFARLTDELGDSFDGDRRAALDWLEQETAAALAGREPRHLLVAGAVASVGELGADPAPLFDLIQANRWDQDTTSYATIEDLVRYCRKSADPVGRLVLAAFGHQDARRVELSDAICTGLQLVEHWQDVREDALAGRIYLPAEDLERFGVEARELSATGPPGPRLRALMVFEVARARTWLDRGAPLVGCLRGSARWAVAGFVAGGRAALDAIAAADFDVMSTTPRPSPARVAGYLLRKEAA